MKKYTLITLAALALIACEKNPEEETSKTKDYNVSGLVEKGPFVSGSTINLQPLSEEFAPVGTNFHTEITDNEGSFNLGKVSLSAPYATLTANGYFFNEVVGELSKSTLSLNAIVDLTNKSTVNVNLLTHLKYYRVQHLLGEGKSFKDADKQAQEELFTAFGLQAYNSGDVSQYSIAAGTDQAAALIAISSLLLVNRSEAQLTEYLSNLSKEFGDNGVLSASTKTKMAADLASLKDYLDAIPANIINRYNELGKNVSVKELYPYFDWDGDGVADNTERPSFVVSSDKRTADGRVYTFTTNCDWRITEKPSWVTIEPSSGTASSQPQTIIVKGTNSDLGAMGQNYPFKVSYGNAEIELQYKYYPIRNHSDKRLLLMYSAGFNSISAYMKSDLESLYNGYVPTSDAGDDILLVFSRFPEKDNQYATPTKPVLTKVYENEKGELIKETLKEWDENTPASTKETMQSVFAYITEHFPGYKYGMVFSSHGSGWLPSGYYANPATYGDDYSGGSSAWNVSTKSIGQDHNADGTNVEMELKDFADGITAHLDYLICDAAYMAGVEVAYELRNKCDYFAASATEILVDGLDYDKLSYRLLCSSYEDIQGVCNDYYVQYANQSGQYQSATISMIDCSRMDHLAEVCTPLFEKWKAAFAEAKGSEIQSFNRFTDKPFFYDMADIFRYICGPGDADYTFAANAIAECVAYKANTPKFLGQDINTFCGLSMFLPCMGKDFLKSFYSKNISWCQDTKYFDAQSPENNPQYLLIQYAANTKSTISIEELMNGNPFQEGLEVSVNGENYTLERYDQFGGQLGVKVPKAEKYIVSAPAGKVIGTEHVARVFTTVEANQTEEQGMYFYGALAPYAGIEVGNPGLVQMTPCFAIIQLRPDENIGDIEIGPVADGEFFAGAATYVPREEDKYLFTDLNPDINFESWTSKTIVVANDFKTDGRYIVTFPQQLSQGLKVKYVVAQRDPNTGEVLSSQVIEKSTSQITQLSTGTLISLRLPNQ